MFSFKINEKYLQFQTIATISIDDHFFVAPADGKAVHGLSLMIQLIERFGYGLGCECSNLSTEKRIFSAPNRPDPL